MPAHVAALQLQQSSMQCCIAVCCQSYDPIMHACTLVGLQPQSRARTRHAQRRQRRHRHSPRQVQGPQWCPRCWWVACSQASSARSPSRQQQGSSSTEGRPQGSAERGAAHAPSCAHGRATTRRRWSHVCGGANPQVMADPCCML